MKKIITTAIAVFVTTTAVATFAANNSQQPQLHLVKPGVLTVCTYPYYKPTIYEDQNGKVTGYEADVLGLVAQRMNLVVEYKKMTAFKEIWLKPMDNKCDVAAAGLLIMAERQQQGATFTAPVFATNLSLLIRTADKNTNHDVKDLAGKKVGFLPGSANDAKFKSLLPQSADLVRFKNEALMLNALNDKKIDAIADDAFGNGFQARSNPQLSMIDIAHTQGTYAFAVSSKNKILLLKLNQNLKKLKENGSLPKAYSQWFQQKMNF